MENLVKLKEFWNSKNVLITGHTGFKGSWLTQSLVTLGSKVTGVSLDPPTEPNLFSLLDLEEIKDIRCDIRDREALKEIFRIHKPEIVFHLAAQPIVRYSYEHPVETYEVNVIGTLNVLEAIRNSNSVRSGVLVTTDKCYENVGKKEGYTESDPMGGYDPYSSSKGAAELLISSYRNSFFSDKKNSEVTGIASVRAGNVIGGGDWAQDRLMPDIISSLQNEEDIMLRNPNHVRPWQHVLEPTFGYLHLAQKLSQGGSLYATGWNFGPDEGDEKSVEWITEEMIKKWNSKVRVSKSSEYSPYEAHYLKLNCSKAEEELKWRPKLNISEALDYIVEWYKQKDLDLAVKDIVRSQILNYINK